MRRELAILVLVLVGCGGVSTSQALTDGRDSAAAVDQASDSALEKPAAHPLSESGVEASPIDGGAPELAGPHEVGALAACPGLSHLEPCPAGGTVGGKRYMYCFSSCADLGGVAITACDNNNSACVASCADCSN